MLTVVHARIVLLGGAGGMPGAPMGVARACPAVAPGLADPAENQGFTACQAVAAADQAGARQGLAPSGAARGVMLRGEGERRGDTPSPAATRGWRARTRPVLPIIAQNTRHLAVSRTARRPGSRGVLPGPSTATPALPPRGGPWRGRRTVASAGPRMRAWPSRVAADAALPGGQPGAPGLRARSSDMMPGAPA